MIALDTQEVASDATTLASYTLVVIDTAVEDYPFLVDGVVQGATVLVLDRDRDGIEQTSQAILDLGCNVTSLHLVAHGSPGCLHLGNTELSLQTIESYSLHLTSWFLPSWFYASQNSVIPTLYLYSCCAVSGEAGAELMHRLHDLTGARVAASTVPLGAVDQVNNWELNAVIATRSTDAFTPQLPFLADTLANYAGVLV
ncbi:MAG TPA: DUF4347 domain-containing protein [Leptolyngbyaceae cyanobacterium M33_DOE_097]|uniref:DUF4347 domain-containing protein n=1 Tax=Oscillatoriales cyanobacterium SpSt-418 TaxID=2282169 RepID=A0A7C3PDG6_9CYAN|nr:DUF4347 domain-containing protein [Leptolyngbyaceae cyanobacterium M33_DOE_097]